jgi:hypothetical protein
VVTLVDGDREVGSLGSRELGSRVVCLVGNECIILL